MIWLQKSTICGIGHSCDMVTGEFHMRELWMLQNIVDVPFIVVDVPFTVSWLGAVCTLYYDGLRVSCYMWFSC